FFEGERMTALPPISLVVFEATGGYEKWLHSYLIERGLPYHEAHPLRVRRFAQGKGYFAKTDKLDACILSQYGAQEERQADQGMSQQQLKLREYAARRAQLKALLATERQRLKSVYLEPRIARSIQRIIKQLARELAQVTQYLAQAIQQDETLQRKQALLKTAKGVGEEVS
ncbi:MAG: transposase, partial [Gammaproteobacteria bacterium]|nr:transposase [Gammaproteobacteria bacterium]